MPIRVRVNHMKYLLLSVILVCILVYAVLKMSGKKDPDVDTYVCDVCGERHCVCHKEEDR